MKYKRAVSLVMVLCVGAAYIGYMAFHTSSHELTVAFLDVGQGDAIFITSSSGRQVLIDGGSGKQILRQLGEVMPFYDRSIDMIIATHPDQDHIGGFPFVLSAYTIGAVVRSGYEKETALYKTFNEVLIEEGSEVIQGEEGMVINLGDGVHLDIINGGGIYGNDANAASLVIRMVYKDAEVMLTGDAPASIEYVLATKYGDNIESDILKAGHHGSHTSNSRTFIGHVDPDHAIISAGEDNRYGHPHDEVMETFSLFEIDVLHTKEGNVICRTQGEEWKCGQ